MGNFTTQQFLKLVAISFMIATQGHGDVERIAFSVNEKFLLRRLSPVPNSLPASPGNAFADNNGAAAFGKKLFFSKDLSRNGKFSCATCHDPERGWADGKRLSDGQDGPLQRNTPTILNSGHFRWLFWDGRADSLWAQATGPLLNENEMAMTPSSIVERLRANPALAADYRTLFGKIPPPSTEQAQKQALVANLGKALEAFQRHVVSTESPFDQFVKTLDEQSPDSTISPSAQRGAKLFIGKARCTECHSGSLMTDFEFHNLGLPRIPNIHTDRGRLAGISELANSRFRMDGSFSDHTDEEPVVKLAYLKQSQANLGQFKTPSLRDVALTAPYMHDGRFATLSEVLEFYSVLPVEETVGTREKSLTPLRLSDQEKKDLEAFLKSLTSHSRVGINATPNTQEK